MIYNSMKRGKPISFNTKRHHEFPNLGSKLFIRETYEIDKYQSVRKHIKGSRTWHWVKIIARGTLI